MFSNVLSAALKLLLPSVRCRNSCTKLLAPNQLYLRGLVHPLPAGGALRIASAFFLAAQNWTAYLRSSAQRFYFTTMRFIAPQKAIRRPYIQRLYERVCVHASVH